MRNLSTTGLSLSQAQSISNLCNQRAQNINAELAAVNNAEKSLKYEKETYIQEPGVKMPSNVIELLLEKGRLHATQAFLMEAIKAKDSELKRLKSLRHEPSQPRPIRREVDFDEDQEESVDLDWGWNQLTDSEMNEYREVEAYAAHIGQFIHEGSILDRLRSSLIKMPTLEWISIEDGKKTPVKVSKHHTPEQLNTLHEKLAESHRQYEQRVNYYKAKVHNLVTLENAARQTRNAAKSAEFRKLLEEADTEYKLAMAQWNAAMLQESKEFEADRELKIKDTAALRIKVDPRFQPVIDLFLSKVEE